MSDLLERLKTALADRYAVEREIGEGGMATVYLAEDLKHHRKVAVKVLRSELAAAMGPERFLREIEIAAQLQHPHVLPLYDSGQADGFLYYVMPYVEGESLRAKLARERELPIAEAVRILRDVVDALAHAHERGVVHRDIKPDNVMLSGRHALVTDFGVAKAVGEATGRQEITTVGVALGTPSYMAPEQAAADPQIDHRVDIYAVGAMAYELLTGRPPFTGTTPQLVLAAHVTQAPEPVTMHRQTVPMPLAALVMKCLEKKPADRWQQAEEMLSQLEGLATPSAGITPTETRPHAAVAAGSRRRIAAAVAGAVVVVGGLLGVWTATRGEDATPVDPNLVAVLPFRVAGADPSLSYLSEGMIDLLAAKLTGEGGPRAADPRTVVAAWRRAGGDDMGESEAAEVARGIGAGQLLLGSVVGSPTRVVLNASLVHSTGRSLVTAQSTVEGPTDSLPVLLDRLVGELLVQEAGVGGENVASLTTESLDALKAYIDGRAAYRRAQYEDAARHLSHAIGLDSGFVLAALALIETAGWYGPIADIDRVSVMAWEGRERLSPRDRMLLEARMGPAGPVPDAGVDQLAVRERAVAALPDQADAWYLVGDTYYHIGLLMGFEDAPQRAERAFHRAIALDSMFGGPFSHLLRLAIRRGDTAEARRLWAPFVKIDSTSVYSLELRWSVATLTGDDEMRRDALERFGSRLGAVGSTIDIAQAHGQGIEDLDTLLVLARRLATTGNERSFVAFVARTRALNGGRPQDAQAERAVVPREQPVDVRAILDALFWGGLRVPAEEAAAVADSLARAPLAPAGLGRLHQLNAACALALWCLAKGEASGVPSLVARLQTGIAAGDTGKLVGRAPTCTATVEAWLAVRSGRPDARRLVERLDSILLRVPGAGDYLFDGSPTYENLVLASLLEELGEPQRALGAVRRQPVQTGGGLNYLSTRLRQEGRLAALVGDRDGAIEAYSHYLTLRPNPEPEVQPEVEAVRAELARLVGEGSR